MQTRNTTTIVQITTCDPSTRTIQGKPQDQSPPIGITVKDIPIVFRWPLVGEMWRIQQRSNNWYLAGRIALASDNSFIESVPAGDVFLDGANAYLNDGARVITTPSGSQVGDILPSAAATRVNGLLCNGQAVSRTTYAALYAAIGTAYGTGDGSTTFNVPDLRGRFPLGAGTGTANWATTWTLGEQPVGDVRGGAEAHVLSVSEIPAHAHQFFSDVTSGSNAGVIYSQNQHGYSAYVGQTTQNAGGGGAHIQMPPASVVNFFIVYQ